VTRLRICRRGVDDLLIDVDASYALVLQHSGAVDVSLSLHELEAVEVLDAPEPIPPQGGYVTQRLVHDDGSVEYNVQFDAYGKRVTPEPSPTKVPYVPKVSA
jgi:hypothetical protein